MTFQGVDVGKQSIMQEEFKHNSLMDGKIRDMETQTRAALKAKKKPVNTVCNISMWIGIVSIFLFEIGIIPLAGIIVSIVGLVTCKGGVERGRVRATVGLVMSFMYMALNAYMNGHIG